MTGPNVGREDGFPLLGVDRRHKRRYKPMGWLSKHLGTGHGMRMALATSVIALLVMPAAVLAQSDETLYLGSNGVPRANLVSAAPTDALVNLDPERDDDLGLLLEPTSAGPQETDASKYELWSGANNAIDLHGSASLVLSAAMHDFGAGTGKVNAYLQDCKANLKECTTIVSTSVLRQPWSTSGGWQTVTLSFGQVDYVLNGGRKVVVRVTVDSASDAKMRIAYGAAAYPSRLTVTAAPPTTTSTALTAPTAPTTSTSTVGSTTTTTTTPAPTTPAATSTTLAGTTATTIAGAQAPVPGSTTASTVGAPGGQATPAATTTTTTRPPTPAEQALASGDPETLTAAVESATVTGAVSVPPATPQLLEIAEPMNDLAFLDLNAEREPRTSARIVDAPSVDQVLTVVELVLPDAAARVAVSPLVILDVLAGAIFRTGRGISVPAGAAGLVVGLLIVGAGRRFEPDELS
ncbi:MAG: hypothetical protein OEM97_08360 [Acidimicrobiia bacterium]|nr:hypothetical protein [Acidimicrobiia bacterium]